MLATVGWVWPKWFGLFDSDDVTTTDPIDAIMQADPQWWAQFLIFCGTIEAFKYNAELNGKSYVGEVRYDFNVSQFLSIRSTLKQLTFHGYRLYNRVLLLSIICKHGTSSMLLVRKKCVFVNSKMDVLPWLELPPSFRHTLLLDPFLAFLLVSKQPEATGVKGLYVCRNTPFAFLAIIRNRN